MNAHQRRIKRRLPKKEAFLARVREQVKDYNKNKSLPPKTDSGLPPTRVLLDWKYEQENQFLDIRPTC